MKLFYTLLLVGIATILLVNARTFTDHIPFIIHTNGFVNDMILYQLFALTVALTVTLTTLLAKPKSKQFLSIGQLNILAEKEKWLGISGRSSWKVNALQLLLFVSLATGIFMFMGVYYTDSLNNFQWYFIPFVLLFSSTNALAEELIFRFGIVGALSNQYSNITLLVISSVLFGLPHYFGFPSGIIGVVMSGILGYILCKATIETKGLSIAWTIHFVQDIIIFTGLMMMNGGQ